MIADLKPYPATRKSDVPWIGDVPSHWTRTKLRTLLERVVERNRPDLPLLSVVREKGVILRDLTNSDDNHNFIPDDLTNYKRVRRGQFAMNKMKAWQGSYGVSDHEGIVSPAYFVFDLQGVDGRFFHAAIRSRAYVPFFTQASDGVRIGQWDLSDSRMREIPFFVPPPAEQGAIVRFLDHTDRRIRLYIRAKQRLIKLLEEQKQTIIHRAVTRGLDPNVRLKRSGAEWLGDIPEHWETAPLKRLLSRVDYGTSAAAKPTGRIGLLSMRNIQQGEVVGAVSGYLDDLPASLLLEPNDLLFTRTNGNPELVGKIGIYRGRPSGPLSFASYLVRLRVTSLHDSEWLHMVLGSHAFWGFARSHALVNLQTNLNSSKYIQFLVPLPPKTEQVRIAEAVNEETNVLRTAVASSRQQIELAREYLRRLISDVVTGKLDVRDAAARLPEETSDVEPLDESDTEVEDNESADTTEAAAEEAEA